MSNKGIGILAAICTIVCWSLAYAAVKIAVREYSPFEMTFIRLCAASISLGIISFVAKEPVPNKKDLVYFAILGLIGHAMYSPILSFGLTRVPASTASFIIASAPIFMVLIGKFSSPERMTLFAKIGMAVSIFGVALVSLGRGGLKSLDWFALFVLAAALCQAAYSMGQRPLLKRYSGLQVITYSVFFATLFMTPWAASSWDKVMHGTPAPLLCTIYMGVITTALGYWLWALTVRKLPVAMAGAFLYAIPALTIVVAWVFLHELPTVVSVVGGALILIGVGLVQQFGQTKPLATEEERLAKANDQRLV